MGRRARVVVDRLELDPMTEVEVADEVLAALEHGHGGRIATPNVDITRLSRTDESVREHLADASIVVADGMPLVWASRLAGQPLPERVPGASLIWTLSYRLGLAGRSAYLLGGLPDTAGDGSGARRAAEVLAAASPGLRIAGCASPPYGFEHDPEQYQAVCAEVVEAKPDLVFVGLGFPKQERVISALRAELPFTWFLGCGAAISFVAGDAVRAPLWMQRAGLEWLWRLAGDPRRLAGRYLRYDAPYAVRLLVVTLLRRAGL